jgi:AcrR family transcriptional regulator
MDPSGEYGRTPPQRRRMKADHREELILAAATEHFAEYGLGAGTTQLARSLHITQPLLYKYFPSKDALISRVYERLIDLDRRPDWKSYLADDTLSPDARLKRLYRDYHAMVLTRVHVRLFLFSGLGNGSVNARYFDSLSERMLQPVAHMLRRAFATGRGNAPLAAEELELVQSLHGAVYQIAFRQWVHGEQIQDAGALIDMKVDLFLSGAAAVLARPGR